MCGILVYFVGEGLDERVLNVSLDCSRSHPNSKALTIEWLWWDSCLKYVDTLSKVMLDVEPNYGGPVWLSNERSETFRRSSVFGRRILLPGGGKERHTRSSPQHDAVLDRRSRGYFLRDRSMSTCRQTWSWANICVGFVNAADQR